MHKKQKIFVGMSGGVDSSVTALLLKEQGHDVTGVFLRCYNIDGCAERDAEDARRVAEQIGIPFYVWDMEEEYKSRVVKYMVEGYAKGLTPNPDIACNREIKFGLFLERALRLGADAVATGHYVQKFQDEKSGLLGLRVSADQGKDQSYFLWTLTQEDLAHACFPIGGYVKSEVRALAKRAGLLTAEKKDSQGICFLGQVTLADFLKTYLPSEKGDVLTTTGEKIGEHDGAHFYTIGQRQGLNLQDKQKRLGVRGENATKAHYVSHKDVRRNTITVAEGSEHPDLFKKELRLLGINLLRPIPEKELSVFARVRYRQPVSPAVLRLRGDGSGELTFEESQKFVAEGQSAVFYSSDGEMLGGGVIATY